MCHFDLASTLKLLEAASPFGFTHSTSAVLTQRVTAGVERQALNGTV
jgi:hypothetical protein